MELSELHPIGIEPEGNQLLAGIPNIRDAGLGAMHVLADGLLLEVLGYLDARTLCTLARASKSLYCFCDTEDLWKAFVIEGFAGDFAWDGTWRATFAASLRKHGRCLMEPCVDDQDKGSFYAMGPYGGDPGPVAAATAPPPAGAVVHGVQAPGSTETGVNGNKKREGQGQGAGAAAAAKRRKKDNKAGAAEKQGQAKGTRGAAGGKAQEGSAVMQRLRVRGFYSDLLYQPWHCATCELQPEWLEVDNIERVKGISAADFFTRFEVPNKPCLISDGAKKWPALKRWNASYLTEKLGPDHSVIAGNMRMPFSTYLSYAHANHDEQPLYLFDKAALNECGTLADDYSVPAVFGHDLMAVMGPTRPDFRWLIVGPGRSGSSFHIDPNATSAWNAIVKGRKKWILFPPGVTPPGIHPSADGADVAAPVSLIEWFLNFYEDTRHGKVQPIECVAKPGEVVYVPRGWWHACLNLDTLTIAVTQNFVSPANLQQVLDFLRPGRADLVSGVGEGERGSLHDRFVDALQLHQPQVLAELEAARAAKARKAEESHRLASLFKAGHSVVPAEIAAMPAVSSMDAKPVAPAPAGGGFSFGFSFGK